MRNTSSELNSRVGQTPKILNFEGNETKVI